MRPLGQLAAVLLALAVLTPVRAADLRYFDDAALHAVQFIEEDGAAREGWAVGDDGVVWHSIDGGKNWERQPTGVRASLRSLHFLTPFHGWVAGREELPNGAGSVGVLLYTKDGGNTWRRALYNALPGLNVVHFVNPKMGFLAGDGTDQYPSGLFMTENGGERWQPVPGPRAPSWCAGCFRDEPTQKIQAEGTLVGRWNRLADANPLRVSIGESDLLGGQALRGVHANKDKGFAVGQGGLILSGKCGSSNWGKVELQLPDALLDSWDFHAIHGSGTHFWAVGRPGSLVLHTPDAGRTWEVQRTGQPLPLNGVYFSNETTGWAIGEFGTILGTTDGGKTWALQRRGGQRAAVLFVHARSTGLPVDTVALLGGQEGYLTTALRVTSPDPNSAAPSRVTETTRLALAHRQAGGAAAETLWQFPLNSHTASSERDELLKSWNESKLHNDQAGEHLLRQLVLAVRIWRPSVLITDNIEPKKGNTADALVAEALREACTRAADPKQFPEQITALGLEPWQALKLYGCTDDRKSCHVALDLTTPSTLLQAAARDFATGPAGLLAEGSATVPAERCFRLLAEQLTGAASHKDLLQGIDLAPGGPARRPLPKTAALDPELVKALRQRAALRAVSEAPTTALTDPNKLLAQLGTLTQDLPPELAAPALHGAAAQYVRLGQWNLAAEAYLLLVDRYPTHAPALDAYRWLIRYHASSEARRRKELGQFLVISEKEGVLTPDGQSLQLPKRNEIGQPSDKTPLKEIKFAKNELRESREELSLLNSKADVRKWYKNCLDLNERLQAFGPIAGNDPSLQFALQSARRAYAPFDPAEQGGEAEKAQQWYKQFAARQPDGPWRNAALAELWLINRSGPPPKPLAQCRFTETKPYLDGKLDDACWQTGSPLRLHDAGPAPKQTPGKAPEASRLDQQYQTEVRLAHDREYLYVAIHCTHPEGKQVPALKNRQHDADLRGFDRVSLLLDLDRDYATCFHLQVDQRGCVLDDCWGDKTWDPRWFVALQSEATSWTVEAAIPLTALTSEPLTTGKTWAFNAVRVVPGAGVQSFSQPAEAPEEALRLEGLGLLMFVQETPTASPR